MSKLLDLDAVHADLTDVGFTLGGETHLLKPLSVLDFIENTKLMQNLRAVEQDLAAEFEATVTMVGRSFPTAPVEKLRNLTFVQLNKLVAFSREMNGETPAKAAPAPAPAPAADAPVQEVASIGSENPPTAG